MRIVTFCLGRDSPYSPPTWSCQRRRPRSRARCPSRRRARIARTAWSAGRAGVVRGAVRGAAGAWAAGPASAPASGRTTRETRAGLETEQQN